jgi:hypothetical protein
MEGVVSYRFFRPATPLPVSFHDVLLRIRDHEVDDHRGAAGQRRGCAGLEVFAGHRAHERQLHVCMRVDAARHYELATGIDDCRAGWRLDVVADSHDFSVAAKYVGFECAVGVNDRATFDENRHDETPRSFLATK